MKRNKLKMGDTKIPLATAQAWVKKWKALKNDASRKRIDSYLIPSQNLALVLAQDIDAARAYVGINDKGEETLMLVGTKWDEAKQIYVDMIPGYLCTDEESVMPAGIYDFTEPVPPGKPDPDSPMNI
jgi:hypothetical protein